MNMTREEAIAVLENRLSHCRYVYDTAQFPDITYPGAKREIDAIKIALSALRPVSGEQVVKVWRGEWINKHSAYDHKIFTCARCGKRISIQGENLNFCPKCGSAQTDKAVNILFERLEALHEIPPTT